MSGRHRKPTTSSIGVAKIAVTGAMIGGGSLCMAAQAQAATDSEWDTVASCESSGNWAINTGNGYQGGLQFSPSTWLGYGGGQFASAAHLASKDQQIAIAEKVLAGQGKGAWPVCGRGLSGPTPRSVTPTSAKTHSEAPAAPTDTPVDAPAPAAGQDVPVIPEQVPAPQELPAPADAAPAPQELPADAPAPQELPAPAPHDLPAPAPQDGIPAPAPAPQDLPAPAPAPEGVPAPAPQGGTPAPEGVPAPAPQDGAPAPLIPAVPAPQIISISDTTGATVVQASLMTPLAPADPAVPPVVPTTIVPAPDATAAPADPTAAAVPAAATAAPAPASDGTVVAAAAPEGVQHLPSPNSPPPGTTTDPSQAGNPNVSYLKELWHALKDQEIDRNDLLLALAQRSFTSQLPADGATPEPAPVPVTPAG